MISSRQLIQTINVLEKNDDKKEISTRLQLEYMKFPHLNRRAADQKDGTTPFIAAAKTGNPHIMQWLMDKHYYPWSRVNQDATDYTKHTGLYYAIMFLDAGEKVDEKNQDNIKKRETLEIILAQKQTSSLYHYISHAIGQGNYYFIRRALQISPPNNEIKKIELNNIIFNSLIKNPKLTASLLALPEIKTIITPSLINRLYLQLMPRFPELIKTLVEYGVTPKQHDFNQIILLLENGEITNEQALHSWKTLEKYLPLTSLKLPMFLAGESQSIFVINFIINDLGYDLINYRHSYKNDHQAEHYFPDKIASLLTIAVALNHIESVKHLINRGALAVEKNEISSSLTIAIHHNHIHIVKLLLQDFHRLYQQGNKQQDISKCRLHTWDGYYGISSNDKNRVSNLLNAYELMLCFDLGDKYFKRNIKRVLKKVDLKDREDLLNLFPQQKEFYHTLLNHCCVDSIVELSKLNAHKTLPFFKSSLTAIAEEKTMPALKR